MLSAMDVPALLVGLTAHLPFPTGHCSGEAKLSMLTLLPSGALLDLPLCGHNQCAQAMACHPWSPLTVPLHISLLLT